MLNHKKAKGKKDTKHQGNEGHKNVIKSLKSRIEDISKFKSNFKVTENIFNKITEENFQD